MCGEAGGSRWGRGGRGGLRAPVDGEAEPLLPTAWPLGSDASSVMSLDGEESRLQQTDTKQMNDHNDETDSKQNEPSDTWSEKLKVYRNQALLINAKINSAIIGASCAVQ